ncbi:hypothetical protein LTR85_005890 [Meristemomyces frigidus]|nr:hypothetical protein LTR85_005890 [Meristemomyces frigidus]
MAHNARLGELADGIVTSITGKTKDDNVFLSLKDRATKGCKDHSHARTNQFEIRDKLNGVVEKFAVLNRDDLAEALQARLDELPTKSRWLPEILSLLLELSDHPVERTDLEEIGGFPRPETPPSQLTWEKILADEPLEDDGIWDDVERGYHSSGDDATVEGEEGSEPTNSTDATSVGEDDLYALARLHVIKPDQSILEDIHATRQQMKMAGTESADSKHVSELVLVRESFMMLRGLPNNVYDLDSGTGRVTKRRLGLATAARYTLDDVLHRFAEMGTRLNYLRAWTRTATSAAVIQSVQASLQTLLSTFASELGELDRRFVNPCKETVVSMINVHMVVEVMAAPLLHLYNIVGRTEDQRSNEGSGFALLDALYAEACIAQVSGGQHVFAAFTEVLMAGLRTYLKPAKAWMETGTLPSKGEHDFFVAEADADCEPSNVWRDRFALRALDDGRSSAPAFMHAYTEKAFALGKARAFLQLLDPSYEPLTSYEGCATSAALLNISEPHSQSLLPFEQLLDDALGQWMQHTGMDCTALVCSKLLHEHGLTRILTSLEYVFFAKDGSLFPIFAESLFDRIKCSRTSWQDRFMLTELAQSTLGSAPGVDFDSVTIHTACETDKGSVARPTIRELERLELNYVLPWPIQNITRAATLPNHSAAFVLILQVYYAKCLLRSELFALRTLDTKSKDLPPQTTAMMKLRWRLTWFVETIHSHTTETARAIHQAMKAGMEAADGIDSMAGIWAEYEKRLPVALLLAKNLAPIKDAIVGVLELCERSAQLWKNLLSDPDDAGSQSSSSAVSTVPEDASLGPSPLLEEFDRSLSFIKAGLRGVGRARGETALGSLAERLDWHGG